MILRLSERAERDLSDVRHYTLSAFGPLQTNRYLGEIQNIFDLLLTHPELGKPASHIRENYRMTGVASHIVYYKISDDFIDITAILHQRMNPFLHLDF